MTPPKDEAPAEQGKLPELGPRLRKAREAKGLGPADVARQLRLETRIIEALERDDRAALPSITFVKGYVRSYARLVGLDEEPLLAALPASSETPSQQLRRPPPLSARTPSSLPLGAIFRVLLVMAAIALVLALGYPVVTRLMSTEDTVATGGEEAGALSLPPVTTQSADMVPTELAPPEEIVTEAVVSAESAGEGVAEIVTAEPEPEIEPIVEPIVAAPEAEPVEAPVSEPTVSLVLMFREDSWVEISDRKGRLLFGLMKQGSRRALEGLPPFRFLLGNSSGVDLEYDGAPFDHSPFRRGKVARFSLGEQ